MASRVAAASYHDKFVIFPRRRCFARYEEVGKTSSCGEGMFVPQLIPLKRRRMYPSAAAEEVRPCIASIVWLDIRAPRTE